ncbi:stalk domain-containing protein [Deinococcus sp. SL84]|uniref:stalk domain-containing protein n=1 Tax=Deinococcus sp. SL84 TaxID=2994663 RepID=UPI0022754C88|nr:copper amine oxidase N-terminal domain-containing protein [Deinococcus sp. SL84]MCY1702923.1 copper amine oxidase N-terminal domain-containing protein [Deinococcus sp. SL84]
MLRPGLLSLGLGLWGAAEAQLQLSFSTGESSVQINGRSANIAAPQVVEGRTMLPLNDTVLLLGYYLTRSGNTVSVVGGNLSVDLDSGYATVGGQRQEAGSVAVLGGKLYVSARVIAAGLGGQLSTGSGNSLVLTAQPKGSFVPPTRTALPSAVPGAVAPAPTPAPARPAPAPAVPTPSPAAQPSAPQARFSTDKAVYAPGERVVYTEYSYDPEGGGIASRNWTGRQDVYWAPGSYPVSLQVTNGRGQSSSAYTRTIRVEGQAAETPVTYALRYGQIGDRFADGRVLNYPALNMTQGTPRNLPLLFSDSPEKPQQSGVLYGDQVSGEARLLGYHVNDLGRPARLYIVARNLESRPVSVQVARQGETAPSRVEGILGQVTLMDYFASSARGAVNVPAGGLSALYVSPSLSQGHGVSILQDIVSSGRVAVSFVMLEDGLTLSDAVLRSLPYLPLDGRHQRGTFAGADRPMSTALTQLPARVVIGDGQHDPVLTGRDSVTGSSQRLAGNYGVLYDMEFTGAANTAVALSPRGGLYRGAMRIIDGDLTQVIKLPREGNALTPNEPQLLWRAKSDRVRIQFMPSNGSALPVNLVFYRLPQNTYKWYQP